MTDEHSLAVLFCECLFGSIDVCSEGRERIFNQGYVVALFREDICNRLPARLIDESAMDQHNVLNRAFEEAQPLRQR